MAMSEGLSSRPNQSRQNLARQHLVPRFESAWAYIRHELLYVCWAVMEVALIAPLAFILLPWIRYWPALPFSLWLLLILFIPFNLSRVMTLANVTLRQQRKIMLFALLLTLFLSLRTLLYEVDSLLNIRWLVELFNHFREADNPFWSRDIGLFFLVVLVWWRGISLTNRRPNVQEVGLRLRVGGLIQAPVVIGFSLLPHAPSPTRFILLFFLAGLLAVALTRAEEIALEQTGRSYPMQPRWVGIIFLTSASIVLLAGLAAAALSGQGVRQLIQWLKPLWNALYFLATVVVTTVTYLLLGLLVPLQWLVRMLFRLLSALGFRGLPEPSELPEEFGDMDLEPMLDLLKDSNEGSLFLANRILTIVFIVGVLLLLYIALNRYFKQRELVDESDERATKPQQAGRTGPSLGQRWLKGLARWRQGRAATTVRRLYWQMCEAAAAHGYARTFSQTPYEYLQTLAEAWPEGKRESQLLTEAYIRVRYGELPESEEELQELRAAWRHLEQMKPREISVK